MPNERSTADLSDLLLVYPIRIKGHLRPHWTYWFEGLTITLKTGRAQGKIIITM